MYSKEFLEFINVAKTPFHAVNALAKKLDANGFKRLLESNKWNIKLQFIIR